jgi:hypothetical protein
MKVNIKNVTVAVIAGLWLIAPGVPSCSGDVDFGEQYKKTVYIVNGNNLLYTGEHFFGAEDDKIVISVYCASSEPITHDLKVQLILDTHALDSLNAYNLLVDPESIDKVLLPSTNYQLSDNTVIIQSGKQYGTLDIPFSFTGLDPDIAYALPVSIVSNDAGYDINRNIQSIVYEIKMMNQFSGNFSGSSSTSPTDIVGVQPVLKAMSYNTARMPVHNLADESSDLNTNYMLLTVDENGSVRISPWMFASVTDLGGSTYDFEKQIFDLNYKFNDLVINTVITNINAPNTEEDY